MDSLRSFDVRTQLSIQQLDQIELIPNTSSVSFTDKRKTLLDLLPPDSRVLFENIDGCCSSLDDFFQKAQAQYNTMESTTQFP